MLKARRAASQAMKYKIARSQFRRDHQFVRLVICSGFIVVTASLVSFIMFGTNQANVETTTISAMTVAAIRQRRCSGRVLKLVSKVMIVSKPSSGVTKIQNLPP